MWVVFSVHHGGCGLKVVVISFKNCKVVVLGTRHNSGCFYSEHVARVNQNTAWPLGVAGHQKKLNNGKPTYSSRA
jgi:hypothetical protein